MIKPILFNTQMVQAILEGRKTTTRRIIKRTPSNDNPSGYGLWKEFNDRDNKWYIKDYTHSPLWWTEKEYIERFSKFHIGDILYVRETWCDRWLPDGFLEGKERYGYKADGEPSYGLWGNDSQCKLEVWIPSIHMPKEAARIFLKVTDVRIERLQDMREKEIRAEGITPDKEYEGFKNAVEANLEVKFATLWDSTVNKKDIDQYGFNANPYVWVIEFERIEKSEVEQ